MGKQQRVGIERVGLSLLAGAGVAALAAVATSALLRGLLAASGRAPAVHIVAGAMALSLVAAVVLALLRGRPGTRLVTLFAPIAAAVPEALFLGVKREPLVGAALGAAAIAVGVVVPLAATRLPVAFDSASHRAPRATLLAVLLGALALGQTFRQATFMLDPSLRWASVWPRESVQRHSCMASYVAAADLSRRGVKNIYEASHWPAFTTRADAPTFTATPVASLGASIHDPFEYPPPFLLLPRAALALTNSFALLRALWYVLSAALVAWAVLLVAAWCEGRRGRFAFVGMAALAVSPPVLLNLQFGQYHLVCVALAMAGMVALDGRRRALGSALLGFAIVTKLFPAVLLGLLILRGRVLDALATIAWAAVFAGAGFLVVGPEPYLAFARYQLPRIVSGEAFSFFRTNGSFFVANNQSPFGDVFKLAALGVPQATERLALLVSRGYAALVVLLTIVAAWRRTPGRGGAAMTWLALLGLASLAAPLAPGAYVGATTLWLLTLMAPEARGGARALLLVAAWVLCTGALPLPSEKATMVLGLASSATLLLVHVWAAVRAPAEAEEQPVITGGWMETKEVVVA
jgi:hypothetical protein